MPRFFTDIDDTILKDGKPVQKVIDYIDETAEKVDRLLTKTVRNGVTYYNLFVPEYTSLSLADLKAIDFDYVELVMNDGEEEAHAFKARIIKERLDNKEAVDLFIDNRADTRKAVAAIGVKVMDPADVPDVMPEEDDMEEEDQSMPSANSNPSKLKMTIEEQLLEASAAIAGITSERDDLRVAVEKLTVGAASELEALKVEAASKDSKVAELTASLEVAVKEISGLKEMVASLEAGKVNASKEAAKIVASVGVAPVEITPADAKPSAEAVDHLAVFMSLPVGSKERNDYFAANKHAIIKAAL